MRGQFINYMVRTQESVRVNVIHQQYANRAPTDKRQIVEHVEQPGAGFKFTVFFIYMSNIS